MWNHPDQQLVWQTLKARIKLTKSTSATISAFLPLRSLGPPYCPLSSVHPPWPLSLSHLPLCPFKQSLESTQSEPWLTHVAGWVVLGWMAFLGSEGWSWKKVALKRWLQGDHVGVWQKPTQYYNYPTIKINKYVFKKLLKTWMHIRWLV